MMTLYDMLLSLNCSQGADILSIHPSLLSKA